MPSIAVGRLTSQPPGEARGCRFPTLSRRCSDLAPTPPRTRAPEYRTVSFPQAHTHGAPSVGFLGETAGLAYEHLSSLESTS